MEMVSSRDTTCFFTGHRELPMLLHALKKRLDSTILSLYDRGCRTFVCGGALGFDTLAAEAVLKHKRMFPDLRLLLVLPCHDQTRGWSEANERRYKAILEAADGVEWVSPVYTKGCMHKRNRYMVDNSSLCIAYCTKSTGGTAYTVNYAQKNGVSTRWLTLI